MTNEERARKIVESIEIVSNGYSPEEKTELVIRIETQIREVCKEAVKNELQERMLNLCDSKAYDKGFEAAREKAAEMAEKCGESALPRLADQIREMCYEKP